MFEPSRNLTTQSDYFRVQMNYNHDGKDQLLLYNYLELKTKVNVKMCYEFLVMLDDKTLADFYKCLKKACFANLFLYKEVIVVLRFNTLKLNDASEVFQGLLLILEKEKNMAKDKLSSLPHCDKYLKILDNLAKMVTNDCNYTTVFQDEQFENNREFEIKELDNMKSLEDKNGNRHYKFKNIK